MRSCDTSHAFYCGIDLHARVLYLCVLAPEGEKPLHRPIPASPNALLAAVLSRADRNSIARRGPRRGRVQQVSTRDRRPPARVMIEIERGRLQRVCPVRRDLV